MKYSRLLVLVGLAISLVMAGCGGGSNGGGLNLNGSLNVTSQTADQGAYMSVTFTTSYTNPQKADLLGVPINFVTPIGSYTMNTNNSGTIIQTFWVAKSGTDQFFHFAASTGDLKASTTVRIPAMTVSPLAFSMNPLTFSNTSTALGRNGKGQTMTVSITNGTAPYSDPPNVSPSPNPDITASITPPNLLVVQKNSSASGTASILVTDSSSPQMVGTLTVNY